MGSGNTVEGFLKLGTKWSIVDSFTLWPLYPEDAGNSYS